MKKKCIFAFAILTAIAGFSKEKTIKLHSTATHSGKFETTIEQGVSCDTLKVVPGKDVSTISIMVKDEAGDVLAVECVPSNIETCITFDSSTFPEGSQMEIRDDHGVVYRETNY